MSERLPSEQMNDKIQYALKFYDECWEWQGAKTQDGYGTTTINYKTIAVHRISYELHNGKIPKDRVIDHKCRNRKCFNPNHLQLVIRGDNVRLGKCANRLKPHCTKGHEFTDENTYINPSGSRRCRTCNREFHKKC